MIRHTVPFEKLYLSLLTQFPQNLTYLAAYSLIKHLLPEFWYDNDVIDTVPPNMGRTLPVMHLVLPPPPLLGPSRGENLPRLSPHRSKALWVAPPEAVSLAHTKLDG